MWETVNLGNDANEHRGDQASDVQDRDKYNANRWTLCCGRGLVWTSEVVA